MPQHYPRDLAKRCHAQLFRRFRSECPPLSVLEQIFERLYFASMKREEAESVTCRIAFVKRTNPDPNPPGRIVKDRWQHFPLSQDIAFTVRNLVKLSQAVDPWSSTLAVDTNSRGELKIWGIIDQTVHFNTYVVKESDEGPDPPGMFQAAIEGVGEVAAYRKYTFLGRLRQDVLITNQLAVLSEGPVHAKLLPAIQRFQAKVRSNVGDQEYGRRRDDWDLVLPDEWITALCRILIGIQRYGHGGAVFVSDVRDGLIPRYTLKYPRLSQALERKSVLQVQRTSYSDKIHEDFLDSGSRQDSLPIDLYLDDVVTENEIDETEREITGCIRFITSLSRVDGLIWFAHDLTLQGFGVLIGTEEEPGIVYRADNVMGTDLIEIDIHNFGTRHRSMVRQCWKDPSGVGFVVSQDGDVRAIANCGGRILLWESIGLQGFLNARPARRSKRASN